MPVKNPELLPLFDQARTILASYAPHFTVRRDEPGYYDLWSEREVVIEGRKRKEIFFAGLIVQKHYVGFYYMPIYAEESAREFFGPELLSLLKGKSCFYLKEITPVLEKQLRQALDKGLELYRRRGWV